MPLQGDVATLPVRELLGLLARTHASGRLSVSRGMEAGRFHLQEGRVILASSSEPHHLLGKLLVERGLLNQTQLARALKSRKVNPALLGRTLTTAGLVAPGALAAVLSEKIERLVLDFLSWKDGEFHFDPTVGMDADEAESDVPVAVDLSDLLQRHAASASKTWIVSDADVIEATPLRESPPRRRKRSTAQA